MTYLLVYTLIGCVFDYIAPRPVRTRHSHKKLYQLLFTSLMIAIWPLFFYYLLKGFFSKGSKR